MTEHITSTDPDPFLDRIAEQVGDDPESMADLIESKTDIEGLDALLVALANDGQGVREMSSRVGRSETHVEDRLSELRTRKVEIVDEMEELRRTAAALNAL